MVDGRSGDILRERMMEGAGIVRKRVIEGAGGVRKK